MDNAIHNLDQLLATPVSEPVDADIVKAMTDANPSFLLPTILLLRHPHPSLDEQATRTLVNRIALSLPDPSRLRLLIDPEGTGRYDNFYPHVQATVTPTTGDAIDTFLSTYGNIDPAEEALLNRLIFNPTPDYAATLEKETNGPDAPVDEQDRLLDAFIAADHHLDNDTPGDDSTQHSRPHVTHPSVPAHDPQPATPKAPNGSLLSESLAKIFIKQHNYRRAYEIISSLNLNYPEKSIYFADQMRFLSKLIANEEALERINKTKNSTK